MRNTDVEVGYQVRKGPAVESQVGDLASEREASGSHLPRHEEVINAITHGIGLVLSIVGLWHLWQHAGQADSFVRFGCIAYGLALVTVFAASTISHAVDEPKMKYLLRACDQGVIYLLITGTYTPFFCAYLEGWFRIAMILLMWTTAFVGLISKVVHFYRVTDFKPHSYIALGWIPATLLIHMLPITCALWMALGGVVYTIGTLFLVFDRRRTYFHAIWHTFVIVAATCHFVAIVRYAT